MEDGYIEFRRSQNIRPLDLPNKGKFYRDIMNIEHSFSGRVDTVINTFIMEAAQQLINSMELFEMGYFDCAYYSLRSAVEVSTTMVFLIDMPEPEREKYLEDWKDKKSFPMLSQVLQMLSHQGDVFADMKEKLSPFFEDAKMLSGELNKYVHKQGLQHFYISRNHPLNVNQSQDVFIENFEYYLKKCIGIVAVMRLAGDPFPILLMDEEILYRCFDSMTDAYAQDFVDEYIGKDTVEAYKKTDMYKGVYSSFIDDEKKNLATFNVMKHQYINRNNMSDILSQIHLLDIYDTISVLIVNACKRVVKVYTIGGMQMYFTELNTARKAHSWNGLDFKKFQENKEKHNQPYDEAYISVFECLGENYFVEHNELLTDEEVVSIETVLSDFEMLNTGE